jgi:hypothetical protein
MKKLVRRGLLLIVFLLALQLVSGLTIALAEPGYHVVRSGETLFSIGRLYGVNPYTIASTNGLANPNYIQIGQVLYIPAPGGWSYPPQPPSHPPQPPSHPPQPPSYPPQPPSYPQGWWGSGWWGPSWQGSGWWGPGWQGSGWWGSGWQGSGWWGSGWWGYGYPYQSPDGWHGWD